MTNFKMYYKFGIAQTPQQIADTKLRSQNGELQILLVFIQSADFDTRVTQQENTVYYGWYLESWIYA